MASNPQRIYLDNAATSWPKPPGVYEAVDRYQREVGAAFGRSGYRSAQEAQRVVERARRGVADLVGLAEPRQVAFTANGTDALNTAILGWLRPGDHVVTTVCEHNSVLRPLKFLADERDVAVTVVSCDEAGYVSPEAIRRALQPETRMVAVVHASNVTGAVQPLGEIGSVVRGHGAFFLVDAAQTLGHLPIDMDDLQADVLAASGHKGLLGPLGTGVLCLGPRILEHLQPLRRGGTGSASEQERQPSELPERFEAGNLNVPALAGLGAGLEFLQQQGLAELQAHQQRLTRQLLSGLESLAGVQVHGPRAEEPRTSVVSFTCAGYDPQELAAVLELVAGIECRAGLHCAPQMHRALGTLAGGGTVRLSPGWATTPQDIDAALAAVANLITSR